MAVQMVFAFLGEKLDGAQKRWPSTINSRFAALYASQHVRSDQAA